ncbi:MAG TPA: BolA family protein [Bdellovibrio sp.]|nr:BolA family protein [Bdellovibrio sp.]
MSRESRLQEILEKALAPSFLKIENESSKHAGHLEASAGTETHFKVTIISAAFEGLSRIERQRQVHTLLKQELENGLHALTLKTLTPREGTDLLLVESRVIKSTQNES